MCCKCSIDLETYNCKQICKKKLDCGHECQRFCKDPCICMIPVKVTLPKCGHETTIPCSVKPDRCTEHIQILRVECGHFETILCRYASKETYCKSLCNLVMDCGHICKTICGKRSENDNRYNLSRCPRGHMTYCYAECEETLKCGHSCKGKCASCSKGRWHNPCEEDCNCDLICGHKCKGKCGYCLPCTEMCVRRCFHKSCENKCIEVCKPCNFPCRWQCEHRRCTKLCGEICDRKRCNKPCKRLLSCRHECIGMCGDPCPNQCRICDQDTIRKNQFGKENHSSTRFVQLQDCGHLIRYDIMDTYMDNDEGLCLKRCPKCRKPIRTTVGNRYEKTVNRLYCKLNDVKKHILQNYKLYEILNSSIIGQGGAIEQDTRESQDLKQWHRSSEIFTFWDCRGALNELNMKTVNHFIKSVSLESAFPMHDETLLFPYACLPMTSQHIYEIERELKRYVDKCHLEKLTNMLGIQEGVDSKVREIVQDANNILSEERIYTEDDREKVQTCINRLPKTQNFSKGLLMLSITSTDISKDNIILDGGIQISSLYKKELDTRKASNLKETQSLNRGQKRLKEICSEEIESFKDDKTLVNKNRNSIQKELLQETDTTNEEYAEQPDLCKMDMCVLKDLREKIMYELNKTDEIKQVNETIIYKRNDCTNDNTAESENKETPMTDAGKDFSEEDDQTIFNKESIPVVYTGKDLCAEDYRLANRIDETTQVNETIFCKKYDHTKDNLAGYGISLEKKDTHMFDTGKDFSEEDDNPIEKAYHKEFLPTRTDGEPTHFLIFLTWSGYPYFNCKQSKFHLEQIQNSSSKNSYENGSGSKRKTLDKHNEEPMEKKTKLEYGPNAQRSAPENKRRQHNVAVTEPTCKKLKYGLARSETVIKFQQKRNSDSINEITKKIEANHSVDPPIFKETDTRKVQLKRIEVPDQTQGKQSEDLKNTDLRFSIKKTVRCDDILNEESKDVTEKHGTDLIDDKSKRNGGNKVSDIMINQTEIRDRSSFYIGGDNLEQVVTTQGFKCGNGNDLRHVLNRKRNACKSNKADVKTDAQESLGSDWNIVDEWTESDKEDRK